MTSPQPSVPDCLLAAAGRQLTRCLLVFLSGDLRLQLAAYYGLRIYSQSVGTGHALCAYIHDMHMHMHMHMCM